MLRRVAEHYVGIQKETEKKYRILSEACRKGHPITFDVLYDAKGKRYAAIKEEIGRKEDITRNNWNLGVRKWKKKLWILLLPTVGLIIW